ncbi:MAG: hypothetical protein JST90_06255 [Bacteroidetes bacterium]|nr:hypothetical protein [Bacteroidota bacterium]
MNLTLEKERIKREIDLIEDARILEALKKVLLDFAEDRIADVLHDAPLTDEEMALPGGRVPTREQVEEWLDRDEEDEFLSGDEALDYMRKRYEELKSQRKRA